MLGMALLLLIVLLALSVPALGFGIAPTIAALFLYSVLPILRNTLAGITSVPADVTDAARGMGMTGFPLGRDDEIVLVFRRVDDRIQVVRRNIHFKAAPGTPLGKAVKQNYTDSVLMALPIAVWISGGISAMANSKSGMPI